MDGCYKGQFGGIRRITVYVPLLERVEGPSVGSVTMFG